MATQPYLDFVTYCRTHITGDEKGEAQTFLDRFFTALGHTDGYKGAGATLEARIKNQDRKGTGFADLLWPGRVLIEMKKRGEDLSLHLQQATQYWMQSPDKMGQYIVLCNFDEFWIYDTKTNFYKPVDVVQIGELPERYRAFAFLFPKAEKPLFDKNREDVTRKASYLVAAVYKSLVKRKVSPDHALRFCMQCIIALFAEDVDLLPSGIFSQLIEEALAEVKGQSVVGSHVIPLSYDLIGGLFEAMNKPGIKGGGRYKGVDYFNGGLFNEVHPIELSLQELNQLNGAAKMNWRNVNPAIFGAIFEDALDKDERHVLGAHYTHEQDIKKIVDPCIVEPWSERLAEANTPDQLTALLTDLCRYRVLDPACGSGNFLFIAFKELKMLERRALAKLREASTSRESGKALQQFLAQYPFVNTTQFYGLDVKHFAVELAKVTLMVAKELSWLESKKEATDTKFEPLPLDNLDSNIVCKDALVNADGSQTQWPEVEVIVGNPPYQSKNKMQKEFGPEYLEKLRSSYPEVPGRADFCVYWYFKAHHHMKPNSFAGLVGTNTIRQNYSREGSLDYIVHHGGTIFNAVSSQDWPGAAAVFVSIVSWKKGDHAGTKKLFVGNEKGEDLKEYNPATINSSLSLNADVAEAKVLEANKNPKQVFQGQTHGHVGFLMNAEIAKKALHQNAKLKEVLRPFLVGEELLNSANSQPKRFVIDFTGKDLLSASTFKAPFNQLKEIVLPEIEEKAELERSGKMKENGRQGWLNSWWLMWRRREDLINRLQEMTRFISCSRVSKRPIFEFVSSGINPNDALMAFTFEDDYSFGILQSNFHWEWWKAKCSTLEERLRYTTDTVSDTFPWPQNPTEKQIEAVAKAAVALRLARRAAMSPSPSGRAGEGPGMSLRDLYRLLELPGKNPIKDLHHQLDKAVAEAYRPHPTLPKGEGLKLEYGDSIYLKNPNPVLEFLLALNLEVAEKEAKGEAVQGPGLPDWVANKERFVSEDCVKWEG